LQHEFAEGDLVPFTRQQAPLAHNKIDEIETSPIPLDSPFTEFTLCWMAFNNIYSILTRRALPVATALPQEQAQLRCARGAFPQALKDSIIRHDSTRLFFLTRVPQWNGRDVAAINGVVPNGVVNLAKSEYACQAVVREIDRAKHASWMAAPVAGADCDELVREIVDVVYTVRCNTIHGGKDTTDDNATTVVNNAYFLVRTIVDSFLIR
jgi:hypothetical protein